MEENETPKRGGSRPGSGRKASGKKMVSARLAPDVVAILDAAPNGPTAYLEAAVRAYHATQ